MSNTMANLINILSGLIYGLLPNHKTDQSSDDNYVEEYQCGFMGDHTVWHGPSSHLERPVESEVRHMGPTPMNRFSCGESGLHCT